MEWWMSGCTRCLVVRDETKQTRHTYDTLSPTMTRGLRLWLVVSGYDTLSPDMTRCLHCNGNTYFISFLYSMRQRRHVIINTAHCFFVSTRKATHIWRHVWLKWDNGDMSFIWHVVSSLRENGNTHVRSWLTSMRQRRHVIINTAHCCFCLHENGNTFLTWWLT